MVALLELVEYLLVLLVCLLVHRENDVGEALRLGWVHLDQQGHVVLRVKEAIRATRLVLGVNVITVPLDDIVLVILRELVQRMDLVLDDCLAAA